MIGCSPNRGLSEGGEACETSKEKREKSSYHWSRGAVCGISEGKVKRWEGGGSQ
jgi:hypothetical protein